MPKLINLTGRRFGRLKVLKQTEKDRRGNFPWLCLCDCGNQVTVLGYDLKRGRTKSCGCLRKEKTIQRSTKHNHARSGKITGIYRSWHHMKQRCTNPNDKNYKDYGGKGITVCKRWLRFKNFLKDMVKNWKPSLTIERKNNSKGYYRKNCKWVTKDQQNKNRRNSLYVPYEGKIWLFVELCKEYNMSREIVYARFYRLNWTLKEALTTPVQTK